VNSFLTTLLAQTPAATPLPSAAPVAAAVAAGLTPMQYLFGVVYMGVCIFLIIAILSRTTKNEGLSGSMMGGADSSFRGAKSTDQTIDTITNVVATAFVVMSIALNYAF
jgi:protein translocase SecG subunit